VTRRESAAAIEVEGLVKSYGERRVLDGIALTVSAGSIVALLGPNGAGKTTTVEILEGYRRADAGRVAVLGIDPATDATALRPRLGVMLQAGGLYPLATPRELVRLYARYFRDPRDPDALIAMLGLGSVAGSRVRTLSGGERQRLGLALALVGRPELLVLDEPTAGMDPAAKRETRELLADLRRDGATILLTTHELADVERLADRVVVLDRGRVLADERPAELVGSGARALRFRVARELGEDEGDELGRRLRGTLATEPNGWLRLDGVEPSPATVADLAAWCADRSVEIVELRTKGGSLEERYLELVGPPEAPE